MHFATRCLVAVGSLVGMIYDSLGSGLLSYEATPLAFISVHKRSTWPRLKLPHEDDLGSSQSRQTKLLRKNPTTDLACSGHRRIDSPKC